MHLPKANETLAIGRHGCPSIFVWSVAGWGGCKCCCSSVSSSWQPATHEHTSGMAMYAANTPQDPALPPPTHRVHRGGNFRACKGAGDHKVVDSKGEASEATNGYLPAGGTTQHTHTREHICGGLTCTFVNGINCVNELHNE
jgi:hypothetical protein